MAITWSLTKGTTELASATKIDSKGNLYIAVSQNEGTFNVVATDGSKTGTSTVTVDRITPEISPKNPTINPYNELSKQFSYAVGNITTLKPAWSISNGTTPPATGTTINPSTGLLTVSPNQASGTIIINATLDSLKTTTTVTFNRGNNIKVLPEAPTLNNGTTTKFTGVE